LHVNDLVHAAAAPRSSRRQFFRRATALGLFAPALTTLLAACSSAATPAATTAPAAPPKPTTAAAAAPAASAAPATSPAPAASAAPATAAASAVPSPAVAAAPAASPAPAAAGAITVPTGAAKNPLNVSATAPLDVVIFKGGFGDDYAINAEKLYQANFPDAKIGHQGIQRLQEQLQPRFVGGNPPDVIDNSGAGNLDNAALIADDQLAELSDLMNAASFDTDGKTFKDTLLPGSQETGLYDGKQFGLNLVYGVYGIWYSDALFKQKGWQYPTTWDQMITLCTQIKASGMAPWTYQGKYPYYMTFVLNQMLYKTGGIDAIKNIDNLVPGAWMAPEVKAAANALYQLAQMDFIMPGTEGLTHTESQTAWLQGKAAFIPCGNWLENEMKGLIPDTFNMVIKSTPSVTSADKVPQTGIQAAGGEGFIVPSKGKNVAGGKEYLRALMSKQSARFFSQNTRALSVVAGAADGLDLGTAFASADTAVKAAGANTFVDQYGNGGWYKKLYDDASNALGEMLNKRMTPDQFLAAAQASADAVSKDDSVKKYTRA
jgi:N-acetylglucosamine transport system substrate-binding protein